VGLMQSIGKNWAVLSPIGLSLTRTGAVQAPDAPREIASGQEDVPVAVTGETVRGPGHIDAVGVQLVHHDIGLWKLSVDADGAKGEIVGYSRWTGETQRSCWAARRGGAPQHDLRGSCH
jgi:hypothetical protein